MKLKRKLLKGVKHFVLNDTLLMLTALAVALPLCSCRTREKVIQQIAVGHTYEPEHSPNVFLLMYDAEIGKEPLLKAIKDYGCEIVYDYKIINGMALKKPEKKTLEETMEYFRSMKGVLTVEYDHINRLIEPVRPRLERE